MKRVLLLAAFVALIAGGGIAYAASSHSGLPGGPAVWGGGHAATSIGDRDLSIVATPAGGEFLYGSYGLTSPAVGGNVTCINVSGNNAVIGGIIREAYYSPQYVGYPFISYVTDNGKLAATTADQISATFIVDPPSVAAHWGGITKAFPHVCPPFSAKPDDEVTMFDLTSGDIVVQPAGK